MSTNNLSKLIRYVADDGNEIIFDYSHGYMISKPDGIDTLSIDLTTAQGIGQIGASVQATSIQPRPITINGIITGAFVADKKDRLQSVFYPAAKGILFADDWQIDVYVQETPVLGPKPQFPSFQIGLLAPYPYWRNKSESTNYLTGVIPLFRFPWNISRPYRFGQKIQVLYAIINNSGQSASPFTLRIEAIAKATNPKIENMLTGEELIIEKSMQPGETIIVQTTHDRTIVTSTVDGDVEGALTIESNLFRLHPGDNVIRPSAESGIENLKFTITFAPERVGMFV